MAFAPVVAHMVRLAAGLDVGVHARRGRHIAAVEIRVRHLVQNRIVNARCARNLAEVLTLGLALLFVRCGGVVDGLLVVLLRLLLMVQLVQVLLVVLRIVFGAVLLCVGSMLISVQCVRCSGLGSHQQRCGVA